MLAAAQRTESLYVAPAVGPYATPFGLEEPLGAMDSGPAANLSSDRLQVLVRSITLLAADTIAVELVPDDEVELPAFEAGAHVDLLLPHSLRRSSSLCKPPSEWGRHLVGVEKATPRRGAPKFIPYRPCVG